MNIYLSGPRNGGVGDFHRFSRAGDSMVDLFSGCTIVNPLALYPEIDSNNWEIYIDRCLESLKTCTHINMLFGWEKSMPSVIEYFIAKDHGLAFV